MAPGHRFFEGGRLPDVPSPASLDRTLVDAEFYGALRDKLEPGKAISFVAVRDAACR